MKYHIWTVGCQMNKADSERIAAALERMAMEPVARAEQADLIVVNSCSVRQSAEQRVLSKLGSLKPLKGSRGRPLLALVGCMVGSDMEALRQRLPFVDLFLPPSEIQPLVDLVRGHGAEETVPLPAPIPSSLRWASGPARWVPVIYGCDRFCSYCIVPLRRGRERSRPVEEIVCEVQRMVEDGAREVTLLGQIVDRYGHDLPGKPDLADLLATLDDVQGLLRIRFLTSHPRHMTEKIIDAVATLPRVCEHIVLPVQSGDDTILKAMRRGYSSDTYRRLVARIRERIPGVSLSTDVIVGFPSETAAQFQRTYGLVAELRFDVVHTAMFSPRPGTTAATWPDGVPPSEKKTRLQRIEALQESIALEINQALVGQTAEVLVEREAQGKWEGRTRTNKLVFFSHPDDWTGKLAWVTIERASAWSLQGRLCTEKAS